MPNPLKNQTWDTEGIELELVARRTTTITNGEYCVTVTPGLWSISAQIFPEEEEKGLTWDYGAPNGVRAYIVDRGINSVNIRQANLTLSGKV